MGFLGFITKKKFYIHLGISLILSLVLLIVILRMLKSYTHHGEAYTVPDLTGMTQEQLRQGETGKIFKFLITDSIYDHDLLPGSVIKQNPTAGSKAKKGRTIYLTTISYSQELIAMPALKDLTIRQAVTTLKSNGLSVSKLIYRFHFAENAVLGHYFEGDTVMAGMEIPRGSEVDLVVGLGRNLPVRVPLVIGLTREEARDMLHMSSFNTGMEHYLDERNQIHSKVYRQSPNYNSALYPGESVTLYYRSDLTFNFDSLKSIMNPDTAVILSPLEISEDIEDF